MNLATPRAEVKKHWNICCLRPKRMGSPGRGKRVFRRNMVWFAESRKNPIIDERREK